VADNEHISRRGQKDSDPKGCGTFHSCLWKKRWSAGPVQTPLLHFLGWLIAKDQLRFFTLIDEEALSDNSARSRTAAI
jgi:hypothetical protein